MEINNFLINQRNVMANFVVAEETLSISILVGRSLNINMIFHLTWTLFVHNVINVVSISEG